MFTIYLIANKNIAYLSTMSIYVLKDIGAYDYETEMVLIRATNHYICYFPSYYV